MQLVRSSIFLSNKIYYNKSYYPIVLYDYDAISIWGRLYETFNYILGKSQLTTKCTTVIGSVLPLTIVTCNTDCTKYIQNYQPILHVKAFNTIFFRDLAAGVILPFPTIHLSAATGGL